MEALFVDNDTYDSLQGGNDLDTLEDNLSKRRKKRIQKRKARRAKRLIKRGKTAKAKKVLARGRRKIKRIKKRHKVVRKVARKTARIAKKIARAAATAPLLPLKGVMVSALKVKGEPAKMSWKIDKVASAFYNKIVRKDKNFDSYDEIHLDMYDEDNLVAVGAAIVTTIIEFIKNSKNKKARGEKLSPIEEKVVTGTEQVEEKIKQQAQEEASKEVGKKLLFDKKTQMIIIGVILVIVAAAVYVAKKGK